MERVQLQFEARTEFDKTKPQKNKTKPNIHRATFFTQTKSTKLPDSLLFAHWWNQNFHQSIVFFVNVSVYLPSSGADEIQIIGPFIGVEGRIFHVVLMVFRRHLIMRVEMSFRYHKGS